MKNDVGNVGKSDLDYFKFHIKRFKFLLGIIKRYEGEFSDKVNLLDIGPSFQTELIRKHFPLIQVSTLGAQFSESYSASKPDISFDLNKSNFRNEWPKMGKYDVVVMAEVLEYLYIPPEYIFEFVESILKPGGIFIIQVSNGVAFFKRFNFLFGKKICGKVTSESENAVHLREYTTSDLILLGDKGGLKVDELFIENYYFNSSIVYGMMKLIFRLNKRFNEGITVVYKK